MNQLSQTRQESERLMSAELANPGHPRACENFHAETAQKNAKKSIDRSSEGG